MTERIVARVLTLAVIFFVTPVVWALERMAARAEQARWKENGS